MLKAKQIQISMDGKGSWRDSMAMRWVAAGFLEAEKAFRRLRGHQQMPLLTHSGSWTRSRSIEKGRIIISAAGLTSN